MRPKHKLTARWDKRENDLLFYWPHHKPDGNFLYNVLCDKRMVYDLNAQNSYKIRFDPSFVDELKRRGYDITTLRFEISCLPHENKNE